MVTQRQNQENIDNESKRNETLCYAKLRDIDQSQSAVQIQDSIREKIKRWSGAREIRKWRDTR